MISPKKLIKMARKWLKLAAIKPKRIALPSSDAAASYTSTSKVGKGHFVIYTVDDRRFVIPLDYLKHHQVLRELLKMAEEEYGLPSKGPIKVPCDAGFMEYALSLLQKHAAKDMEKALLMSMTCGHSLSAAHNQQAQTNQQLLICSF